MNTYSWQQLLGIIALSAALVGLPVLGMAADSDQDGITDALETSGLTFPPGGFPYPPCAAGTVQGSVARNACLSTTSKDIFVYLVTAAGGGFLAQNGLINMATNPVDASVLFQFITAPNTATTTGKVDGLGVGVHVAVVNAAPAPASLAVGDLGQKAVVVTVDEAASAYAFGHTDVGPPTNTGISTIWPVYVKTYLNKYVFGGIDKPGDTNIPSCTTCGWKAYIQRTAAHELSHAAALTAAYNSSLGQYHYATGSGTVMDDAVVCTSNRGGSCKIYNDYANGDRPCLLSLVSPTTNPLQCLAGIIQ